MRREATAIAAGRRQLIGRRWDRTVLAAGSNAAGECCVGLWDEIVAVAAGNVGPRSWSRSLPIAYGFTSRKITRPRLDSTARGRA